MANDAARKTRRHGNGKETKASHAGCEGAGKARPNMSFSPKRIHSQSPSPFFDGVET